MPKAVDFFTPNDLPTFTYVEPANSKIVYAKRWPFQK
jgi:hypothetical protein